MVKNIFGNLTVPDVGEDFKQILKTKNVLIERIVSSDRLEPKEYIQEQDEWVVLLKGKAVLKIEEKIVELEEGDYVFIPSKTSHTVLKTEKGTIWLAVHIY